MKKAIVTRFRESKAGSAIVAVMGIVVLIAAAIGWAYGSLFSRSARKPSSAFLGVSLQMIAGGAVLLIIATTDIVRAGERTVAPGAGLGAVPLGTPIIAGPAVLAASVLLGHQYGQWTTAAAIVANIVLVGIGLFSAIAISGLTRPFSLAGGVIALVLGIITLADVLRHRDIETTSAYTRADVSSLRPLARAHLRDLAQERRLGLALGLGLTSLGLGFGLARLALTFAFTLSLGGLGFGRRLGRRHLGGPARRQRRTVCV